ncbi:piercer of microtubule wall 1 protein isoform X1 [Nymphalis io]|uniref:piercer of microtubule wall 1 protein isoform X1 n=1 Tax=Inachis io TaxID=171585 RepID=UPI00216AA950|nr:piercer of microtubule wall 1 protein isoform X1 [Nymphalis io]
MSQEEQPKNVSKREVQPGFCSATCTDRTNLQQEINKSELKTSDLFHTCNLPKRFEHPHWFNGYGCQVSKQHPFYRTSASEYGWYPPGYYSVPSVFFPAGQTFTNRLAAAGMYRNYSLNTGMDPVAYR